MQWNGERCIYACAIGDGIKRHARLGGKVGVSAASSKVPKYAHHVSSSSISTSSSHLMPHLCTYVGLLVAYAAGRLGRIPRFAETKPQTDITTNPPVISRGSSFSKLRASSPTCELYRWWTLGRRDHGSIYAAAIESFRTPTKQAGVNINLPVAGLPFPPLASRALPLDGFSQSRRLLCTIAVERRSFF